MIIDQVFPNVVGAKSSLRESLMAEAVASGAEKETAITLVSIVPARLLSSGCLLDKMTGLWRYEFGMPYDLTKTLVWGSDMWIPVKHLFAALSSAHSRLPKDKLSCYLERLDNPDSHQFALAEMIPAHKVAPTTPMQFEVAGLGSGNHTIDWVIEPSDGPLVLLDVKRRTIDFIQQAERIGAECSPPAPDHDPALLFRSVEKKLVSADPDSRLQGVWISTNIKQNEDQVSLAFGNLDSGKVHFAVFGDWEPDIYILLRREQDRNFLLSLFHAVPSSRFTFVENH
jgi:hypothetical protein